MDSTSRPNESIADSRYFCHSCDAEIETVTDDFTCPTCQLGFIEKVEVQQTPEEPDNEDMEIANAHFMVNGSLVDSEISGRWMSNNHRLRHTRDPLVMTLLPRRDRRSSSVGTIENLMDDELIEFAHYVRSDGNPVSTFLLQNPAIWGRDEAGPPPLTKEKMQEIPTALISQDHLDMELQCSVCWEDFAIGEKVKKLSCDHMYHRDCIIPWLELHGTCPICRKYLADDGLSSINSDPLGNSLGVGQNLAASNGTRVQQRNNDLLWGINDYEEMASTSSDWPAQLGIILSLSISSSSSATQTPAPSGMSTYSSVADRNLRDQRLSFSSDDVEPMVTDHDQNLPAVNNANNS